MLRKFLTRFRSIALGDDLEQNPILDLEFITGRPVATLRDQHGRTGYVFVKVIETAMVKYQDDADFTNEDFVMEIVAKSNAILARYNSPICDRVREINAEILTP